MMTVVQDVALMMTEVLAEAWMTPEVPGVGLMMTGEEEEETTTEVEGEAWMMDVMVVMMPNPGSLWADLVAGVSGRKPERRAGDLPVVETTTVKERKDPATSTETDVHREKRVAGEEEAQMKEAAGGTLAEKTLTAMTAVIAMIAVTAMIVVTAMIAVVTDVTETAGMTVKAEVHPEIMTMVALGVVEAMISVRSEIGNGPEREREIGSVIPRERRVGAPTKKTLVAPRTRQTMTAGPPSAAKHPLQLMIMG